MLMLNGGKVLTVDQVMLAIGRIPNTENLGLEAAGVELGKPGEIRRRRRIRAPTSTTSGRSATSPTACN